MEKGQWVDGTSRCHPIPELRKQREEDGELELS